MFHQQQKHLVSPRGQCEWCQRSRQEQHHVTWNLIYRKMPSTYIEYGTFRWIVCIPIVVLVIGPKGYIHLWIKTTCGFNTSNDIYSKFGQIRWICESYYIWYTATRRKESFYLVTKQILHFQPKCIPDSVFIYVQTGSMLTNQCFRICSHIPWFSASVKTSGAVYTPARGRSI